MQIKLLVTGLLASLVSAHHTSGWSGVCRNAYIANNNHIGPILYADCNNLVGTTNCNFFQLGWVIGVIHDGTMIPLDNGNVGGRCNNCRLRPDDAKMLECDCLDTNNHLNRASINTDDFIGNIDGWLYGHVARQGSIHKALGCE